MESYWFFPEPHVFVGDEAFKVNVDSCPDAVNVRDDSVDARFAVKNADII